ncbi:MAG: hypothetical protein JWM73_958 [Solirubrobacterales bacterium]|nr:hypothetical protein [Solirubrobacterales bacterium]
MNRSLARIGALALLSLVVPAAASAAPTPWGGSGSNDLGPAYALLSVANGKAKVKNVQMIIACTDAEDGTESSRAFSARHLTAVALRQNRYAFDFTATSGGRVGRVRLNGVLRSNGTGTIRVRISATATSDQGAIVERCQGETHFALRRPS